ncbi:hypothetical protein Tco_1282058 [Tanacetum coccineum]
MAMSSVEAGYVVVAGYYAQVLWIKSQLTDYDILYDKTDVLRRIESGGGGGGSVDVVSVVSVTLEGTSADAVRALKIWFRE